MFESLDYDNDVENEMWLQSPTRANFTMLTVEDGEKSEKAFYSSTARHLL